MTVRQIVEHCREEEACEYIRARQIIEDCREEEAC